MKPEINKNSKVFDLIIIGGGIAGSTAAFFAKEQKLDFLLLESGQRLGGVIKSSSFDNQIYEKGPNTLRLGNTLAQICQKIEIDLVGSNSKAKDKYLYLDHALKKLDFKSLFLEEQILSRQDKLAILKFLFRSARFDSEEPGDISVSEFFKLNLSQRVVDNLIWAILNGIYAGNPEKLSLRSIFPDLYQIAINSSSKKEFFLLSLFKHLASKEKQPQNINKQSKSRYFTFQEGLSGFFVALEEFLGTERIKNHSEVKEIIQNQEVGTYQLKLADNKTSYLTKKVILATPAKEASKIYPESLSKLAQIKYAKVVTVNLKVFGLTKKELEQIQSSFGFLSSRHKDISLLGVIYYSALFSQSQTENLLTCFLGGESDQEVFEFSEERIKEVLIHDLQKAFPDSNQLGIELISINRWQRAIPQYNIGHSDLIKKTEKSLPGTFQLAGNYLRGASIEQVAYSGKTALFNLLESL